MSHYDYGEFAYPEYEKRRFFGLLPAKDWADLKPGQLEKMRRKFVRAAWNYCKTHDERDAFLNVL